MARFQLKTKLLKQTLAKMKVALKSTANDKRTVYCEITITDGKITLNSPGVTYSIDAETKGMAKVALPYLYLVNVVKDHKHADIQAEVTEGWLAIAGIKVAAKTSFFADDSILRSVNLPLNYNDADLLKMADNGFTTEELDFNKLGTKIHEAKTNLDANILKAHKALKVYGITVEEIREMVENKVKQRVEVPV